MTKESNREEYLTLKREWKLNVDRFKAMYLRKPVNHLHLNIIMDYILIIYGRVLKNSFYIENQYRLNLKSKSIEAMKDSLIAYMKRRDLITIEKNQSKELKKPIILKYEDITYDILEQCMIKAPRKLKPIASPTIKNGYIVGKDGTIHRLIV